jgi:hypothetical protein
MEIIQNPDLIYLIKLYLQYISIEDSEYMIEFKPRKISFNKDVQMWELYIETIKNINNEDYGDSGFSRVEPRLPEMGKVQDC